MGGELHSIEPVARSRCSLLMMQVRGRGGVLMRVKWRNMHGGAS